jgi:phosphohistidine phosphatase
MLTFPYVILISRNVSQEKISVKKILLMRHAKSSWKDNEIPDIERPLKKKGSKTLKKWGNYFTVRNWFQI